MKLRFLQNNAAHFLAVLLLYSCGSDNKSLKDADTIPKTVSDSALVDSTISLPTPKDTLQSDSLTSKKEEPQKKRLKKPEAKHYPTRFIEFPGDNNFNGSPMIQQFDMPEIVYLLNPDTLSKIAIARYKTYDHFFPKSISDNFEEGVSNEHIHYPKKLIFRFQVFEGEFAEKPYLIKDVVVRRQQNGELYTE